MSKNIYDGRIKATRCCCIDLRRQYGHGYRVQHECGGIPASDPWLNVIVCRYGHIYPHGGTMLGASTNFRGEIAKRLVALPCVEVWQDADDGVNVVFDAKDFAKVAKIMRPRTRRRLSADHLRKLQAANKNFRYGKASGGVA